MGSSSGVSFWIVQRLGGLTDWKYPIQLFQIGLVFHICDYNVHPMKYLQKIAATTINKSSFVNLCLMLKTFQCHKKW